MTPVSPPSPVPRTIRRRHLRQLAVAGVLVLVAAVVGPAMSTAAPPTPTGWGHGTLTNTELLSLIGQMTLPEEVGMVHGEGDPPNSAAATASCTASAVGCVGEAGWIPGVARLGIPPLRMTDGPAGVRLAHVETAMPAPVSLAASFDTADAQEYGQTVGAAGRATDQDVWLGPMVNEVNYPTAGRNFETLGEDPYLAGQLASGEVTGAQSEGFITELKHYIENDFENGRTSTNVVLDDQTLHETELLAFQAAINAGAGSVMCSYNRVNYVYGCGNSTTLQTVLREQLAFTGFVQSDWGAVHNTTDLANGADIQQPTGTSFSTALLNNVENGSPAVAATADYPAYPAISSAQWKQALDSAVFQILTTMNQADLLEGTQYGSHFTGTPTPWVPPRPDLASLKPAADQTAEQIAEDGATLLQNNGNVLPLSAHSGSLAVMGPTAVAAYYGGGGSAHVTPYDGSVGPLTAIQAAAGGHNQVSYVPGYDLDGQVVPSSALSAPDPAEGYPNWTLTAADAAFANQPGLLRQQITTAAVPSGSQPVLDTDPSAAPDQVDATIDYTGGSTIPAGTAFRWSGLLTAPSNPGGTSWQLKVFVSNQANSQLFVDGLATAQRHANIGAYPAAPSSSYATLSESARSHDPANPTLQQATYSTTLTADQQIHLDLRVVAGSSPTQIQLRWVPPDNQTTAINQAVAAAQQAQTVVLFAYDDGTEGSDRGGSDQAAGLQLPGYQNALIAAVAAANSNTIVVLNTGDAVLMPWAGAVKGILEMWYPGQEGGTATANVLFGKVNPGGKLPITFPADATQQPMYDPNCTDTSATGNCPMYPGVAGPSPFLAGATTSYRTITGMQVNGIFEGYRWYDEHNVTPLFPFGYGLSYTSFQYSGLKEDGNQSNKGVDISFMVTNTGRTAGSTTPQVYIGPSPDLPSSVAQAVNKLIGFQRITLVPGQSKRITVHVTQEQLSSWSNVANNWVVGTGTRTIAVGSSSRELTLATSFTLRS